jgi:hypothetical protein
MLKGAATRSTAILSCALFAPHVDTPNSAVRPTVRVALEVDILFGAAF